VTITLGGGYLASDFQHVFDISAGGSVVTSKEEMKYVTPCHWGAKADGVATDTAAVKAAIVHYSLRPGTGRVFFPRGKYKMDECLNIYDRIILEGEVGVSYGTPLSTLQWPANCCGIIFHPHNTTADSLGYNHAIKTGVNVPDINGWVTSHGSTIRHLTLLGNSGTTPTAAQFDWATHGLRLKIGGVATENLFIAFWRGHGLMIRGTSGVGESVLKEYEGGPNASLVKDLTTTLNSGSGLYIDQQDSNAGYFIGINSTNNFGWGIWDDSFLGNTFIACHTNGNWLGAYKVEDTNARSVFIGCYEEGFQGNALNSGQTVRLGGVGAIGLDSNAKDAGNLLGVKNRYISNQSSIGQITITNVGSGYTSAPTVTFAAPTGAVTATATANIIGSHTFAGGIGHVAITNAGAGYSSKPNVVVSGDGTGATLVAARNNTGGIKSITSIDSTYINRVGINYTTATVTVDPPVQTTATGTAYINANGTLRHIVVTNRGAGYTTAPGITISGGGGSGAAATCILAGEESDVVVSVNHIDESVETATTVLYLHRDDVGPNDSWKFHEEAWTGDLFFRYLGSSIPFRITGPNTTKSFGRSAVVPYVVDALDGIWLNSSRQLSYAAAMPTSGEYAKGDFVHNSNISELGSASSKYIILGWSRLVTGTAHVLNTDWLEARCLTGN
jgi:hypothetical protein